MIKEQGSSFWMETNTLKHKNGEEKPYYSKVRETLIAQTKSKIEELLKEGEEKKFISKEGHDAMKPREKEAAKFYCNFKVHKEHEHMKAPPVRPIISGSGSALENVGKFVT